jgi:hypothetical protein
MGYQKNKQYKKSSFYLDIFFGTVWVAVMCFFCIRTAIFVNYIKSQKALARELLAYTKISPVPIVDGVVYEVKTSFSQFNAPYSGRSNRTTTETRKYFYGFTVKGKVYRGATTLKNHYRIRNPRTDMFWLSDEGEKVRIIFNPSDHTRNMPLAWAERLMGWKGDSWRVLVFFGLITVSGGLIYIIWHYLKWVRQKTRGKNPKK